MLFAVAVVWCRLVFVVRCLLSAACFCCLLCVDGAAGCRGVLCVVCRGMMFVDVCCSVCMLFGACCVLLELPVIAVCCCWCSLCVFGWC